MAEPCATLPAAVAGILRRWGHDPAAELPIDMAGSGDPRRWHCRPCNTTGAAILAGCHRLDCPVTKALGAAAG